jgi:hypothetical protein
LTAVWRASLARKCAEEIDSLERALKDCPDDLWEESVWEVKKEDPWVWPINRGMGEGLPDDQRLQIQSALWNVAYHTLFFLDLYLWDGTSQYEPPAPFREDDHQGNALPARMYTRSELLSYVDHNRNKARSVLESLTDEQAERPVRRGQPFGDLLLHNLLHAREHATQINLFLSHRGVARSSAGQTGPDAARMLRDAVRGATDEGIAAFAASLGGYPGLLNLVFQGLAARVEPREDVGVAFSLEGIGEWTLRVTNGKASSSAGAQEAPATVRMTAPDFLRLVTGDAPFDKLKRSIDGDPAAVERLFAQMPDGHPFRRANA